MNTLLNYKQILASAGMTSAIDYNALNEYFGIYGKEATIKMLEGEIDSLGNVIEDTYKLQLQAAVREVNAMPINI